MGIPEELEKLKKMHESGDLSDEEYAKAKANLLNAPAEAQAARAVTPEQKKKDSNQWAMFIHLSLFAGAIVPGAGLVLPIVLWQMKKDEFPETDAHGKVVLNWIISFVIYMTVSVISIFVFVGFLLTPAVVVVGIVFPIIGAMKANEGVLWKYPLSIPIFKFDEPESAPAPGAPSQAAPSQAAPSKKAPSEEVSKNDPPADEAKS